MNNWYVVQTNPKEDQLACRLLEQRGIDVYQPIMERFVFHARKKTLKQYPLFPNYLFVQVDDSEEQLHQVRWCRGVKRMLMDNASPVPIDGSFIKALQGMENGGIVKKPVDFAPGELVRVKRGPMKDLYGIIESWDSDAGRVRILVDMVNNRAKMVMHDSLVEKA